jgi:hypothetical protein
MSKNIILVLMYHCHKLLDQIISSLWVMFHLFKFTYDSFTSSRYQLKIYGSNSNKVMYIQCIYHCCFP